MNERLTRWVRNLAVATGTLVGGLAILIAGGTLVAWLMFGGRGRITAAGSPDGRYRITLNERALGLDRNFHLLLRHSESSEERRLVNRRLGYDQSPAIEREHFIWSEDSRWVALVGDAYAVVPEAELPTGDFLYAVYDTTADKLYCNDRWGCREGGETPFTADAAVELFGPAILAQPPRIE